MLLFALTRFGEFQGEDLTLLGQLRGPKRTIADTLGFFTSNWGLEGNFYAPLPRFFFYLEYRFFVINPLGWHLFSAALHALCSALVWGLAWRLTRRPALALCAGLFFAVLPTHVPVVAQTSSQAELWATIFCLAAAIAFVAARQRPARSGTYYPLALGFYFLALLCKEVAIALPLVLLAYDFVTGGLDRILHQETEAEQEADQQGALSQLVLFHAPFFGLLALYIIIHFAFLGGLSVFTSAEQSNPGEFLRGNLRLISEPFGLGGTDGLILLAALGAFVALTGVQEWEAWRLNNWEVLSKKAVPAERPAGQPKPRRAMADDDELDDPYALPATPADPESPIMTVLVETAPVPPPLQPASALVQPEPFIVRPAFWTLRTAGYGFLWAGALLLPFVLTLASSRTLYLPSVGYALFLGAVLAPFGAATLRRADRQQARLLFGPFELSFWLRLVAILGVFLTCFATSVGDIDQWNKASKPFTALLTALLGVVS